TAHPAPPVLFTLSLHDALPISFQTVVTVNDATIQIVQVRSRETTTIQRNQRTQIWRQYRQNGQDHPLWFVTRLNERFQQFDTLRSEEHTSELQSRFDFVCRLLL